MSDSSGKFWLNLIAVLVVILAIEIYLFLGYAIGGTWPWQ